MLELLGTVAGSIFGGGATGLIGVGLQRWADYKNKQADLELQKAKFEHERGLRELDAKILAQEWAGRTRVAEVETAGKVDVAESEAFAASFRTEPTRYSEGVKTGPVTGALLVMLDVIRALVRPGLTVYLCVLTTLVYLDAQALMDRAGIGMTIEEALKITLQVVGTVLYLTTTCVLWWFGTRNKSAPPR